MHKSCRSNPAALHEMNLYMHTKLKIKLAMYSREYSLFVCLAIKICDFPCLCNIFEFFLLHRAELAVRVHLYIGFHRGHPDTSR